MENWPDLPERYDRALRAAVEYVRDRFDPLGIVASGTIVRGAPDAASDLDLYVIHEEPWRQRVQRFFEGVPTEIFVNPKSAVETYLQDEAEDARPLTAHMLATGIVLQDHPVVERLLEEARERLEQYPDPDELDLVYRRYVAALAYEDARDKADTDQATATMILFQAVARMLEYAFWQARRFQPRRKDRLDEVAALDGELGGLARAFFDEPDFARRFDLAGRIADKTIRARGFFEWESEQELL